MRFPGKLIFAHLSALCLLAAWPGSLSADTIYLKNGRTIVAAHVVQANGQFTYDTTAGQMSIPASIVDRVVRDGQFDAAPGSPNDRAANLPMAPPKTFSSGSEDLAHSVVHDGEIDLTALQRIESAAGGSPSPEALAQLIAAERAAALFEISRGNFERALSFYGVALRAAPNHVGLLLDSAYLHLRRSEYSAALDLLERVKRQEPDSPDAAKLAGWAYYGLNQIEKAVAEWKRALALRPDDTDVQHGLEKATRDAAEEVGYREGESSHFMLRYNGAAMPELAHGVLRTLDAEFDEISSVLNYAPPEPIGVILYTNQVFADITRVPSWVGALNDGRIRVPVDGLTSVTAELARVLKHELTHSFLMQKTHGRCPVWLQEGVAQFMEGKRSHHAAARLVEAFDQHMEISLASYEGSWLNLPQQAAVNAYAWSLAVVETIVTQGSMGDIDRILDQLSAEAAPEEAVRTALHQSYADLMQSTARYLHKAYL